MGTIEDYWPHVTLIRPNATKSYSMVDLTGLHDYIILLGVESNPGGAEPSRFIALLDQSKNLLDHEVSSLLTEPMGVTTTEDGAVYTVGSGSSFPGIITTKHTIEGPPSGIHETAPPTNSLGMPSPVPAAEFVNFEYDIGNMNETTLEIYDPTSRLVTRLVDGIKAPGKYSARWDTREVANGVYLVRFRSGRHVGTRKIVVAK